jgi:hypothetical protein
MLLLARATARGESASDAQDRRLSIEIFIVASRREWVTNPVPGRLSFVVVVGGSLSRDSARSRTRKTEKGVKF